MPAPHEIIDQLSHGQALAILKALAASDEQLANRIAEIGTAYLSRVDLEEVAAVLYDELDALEVEEVWDRAGKTRHGYVEPSEAAYQMVEEVIDPYLEQLKKYQKLGMSAEVSTLCKGLLLGLYQFDQESKSEFKNWAVDAPGEFASTVIEAWKAGQSVRKDVAALKKFIAEELGSWGMHLGREFS
jgi:hypothetical protein